MKKLSLVLVLAILLGLSGCSAPQTTPEIIATTKPVYDFTTYLCENTGLSTGLLIGEGVSCLHDYSLNVSQVKMAENAQIMVISGAGLEEFMQDLVDGCDTVIDSSKDIPLLECAEAHEHDHHHHHEADSHIWLSPQNAKIMATNISNGLSTAYPNQADVFQQNLSTLLAELDALQGYGEETLSSLSCREMVTFHDGFGYFAQAFDLTIAASMEEESGSEASAQELIGLIQLMQAENIPSVFTEINGSASAASIICAEINTGSYALDMGMSGNYFDIMRYNINTVKEALG